MAADTPVQSSVMPTYGRYELVFERGEGAWLVTPKGDRYLDFTAGIAVNALGHANPRLVAALTEQAGRVWHTSNLYRIAGQERLAERLCKLTFADLVFFGNSGAEANEGAIKLARRYHYKTGNPKRYRVITFEGAFHGRTLATIAAGGQAKHLEGFGPKVEGFDQVKAGDLAEVEKAITDETAAVMIEPVQGEGGLRVIANEFMRGLRALCDKHGILLIVDEVQTGVGRTGKLFAYEWSGIKPDIMAIAKGIGGGFPLGAFLATKEVGSTMSPGTHGSTFGGNPLATAVANAVLDVVTEPGFLEGVQRKGLRLKQELARVKDEAPGTIEEIRGVGLLAGVKLKPPAGDVVKAALEQKLLTVSAGDNVVRLLPPLVISEDEIAEGARRLSRALAGFARAKG